MRRIAWAGLTTVLALAACASPSALDPAPSSSSPEVAATSSTEATSPAGQMWSVPARTTSPMNEEDVAAVDAAVAKALDESADETPGAWVGIWSPSKGFYVQAYGEAILPDTAASVADHSYIGSLTKTVTATAVLQQVAAGRMSLSDTVADLDPMLAQTFPPVAGITVEQLLGMTSGLPDYANEAKGVVGMVAQDPTRAFEAEDLIRIGLAANTMSPPGTPGYSTTNYIILGEILKAVTGQDPEDLINAVFAEAGMTQSKLNTPPDQDRPSPVNHGYAGALGASEIEAFGGPAMAGDTDVTEWRLDWGRAGGGAYSTIEDLGRWGSLGLGTALLPQQLGELRLSSTHDTGAAGLYGLGIQDLGKGWFGHSGQVIGWEAFVAQNVETGAVVAVMVNSTSGLGDVESAVWDFVAS